LQQIPILQVQNRSYVSLMSGSTLYAVYILASRFRGTLYIGSTSNLPARIWQHRNHVVSGFSHSYNVTRLVWFDFHEDFEMAGLRERRLKRWRRAWKIALIEESNPGWYDLYDDIAEV
jgi:putative endonuclease